MKPKLTPSERKHRRLAKERGQAIVDQKLQWLESVMQQLESRGYSDLSEKESFQYLGYLDAP
jgi:hypothetical protein